MMDATIWRAWVHRSAGFVHISCTQRTIVALHRTFAWLFRHLYCNIRSYRSALAPQMLCTPERFVWKIFLIISNLWPLKIAWIYLQCRNFVGVFLFLFQASQFNVRLNDILDGTSLNNFTISIPFEHFESGFRYLLIQWIEQMFAPNVQRHLFNALRFCIAFMSLLIQVPTDAIQNITRPSEMVPFSAIVQQTILVRFGYGLWSEGTKCLFRMMLKMKMLSNGYLCYFFAEMLVEEIIDDQTELICPTHFIGHRFLIFIFEPNAKVLAFCAKRIDNPNTNDKKDQIYQFCCRFRMELRPSEGQWFRLKFDAIVYCGNMSKYWHAVWDFPWRTFNFEGKNFDHKIEY